MSRFLKPALAGFLTAAVFVAAIFVAIIPANAADKGGITRAEAEKLAPVSPWTACYAGVSIGAVAGVMDPIFGVDGYSFGGFGGCDIQMGRIVIGATVDYSQMHVTAFGATEEAKHLSFGGRAGVLPTDNTLLYAKLARPRLTMDGDNTNGLAVGAGIDTMLAPNWMLRFEYSRETFDDIPDARAHVIWAGIAYKIPVSGFLPK
jgi:opacity protein-like surface antigen